MLRNGHLRSALVVVGVGFTHGVGTAHTPCNGRLLGGLLPLSDDAQTRLQIVAVQEIATRSLFRSVPIQDFARDASHTVAVGSQGFGLYKSLRSPVALKKQICDTFDPAVTEQWKRNDPNC